MGNKGKRYSEEFKTMIAELYGTGKSASEIISEYGISKTALHSWVNDRKGIKVEQTTVSALDVKMLKAKIKDLEEENDILKKAMTIFAKR